MALNVVTTNINTNIANGFTLAAGDSVYLPQGISIFATGATFSGIVGSTGSVDVLGAVLGSQYGVDLAGSGGLENAKIFIAASGSAISGGSDSSAGVAVNQVLTANIVNLGLIKGTNSTAVSIAAVTSTVLDNSGTIVGNVFQATVSGTGGNAFLLFNRAGGTILGNYDGSLGNSTESILNEGVIGGKFALGSGDGNTVVNRGSITGGVTLGTGISTVLENYGSMGSLTFGSKFTRVANAGEIHGSVTLGNGGGIFDSTLGTIFNPAANAPGVITVGSGGATVVGALNGSTIQGGAGNDILMANQTMESSMRFDATSTLSGGGGTNALYGGHSHNVFLAGTGGGSFNQIWGGVRSGSDYSNNLLSFAQAGAGVYVDLLGGHNAYVGNTAGQGWQGAGTLEDSIANVPNVTGSNFADVIVDDNGVDRTTGGGGADDLFAGSGVGSHDTFVYTQYSDSNLVNGYDDIVGFKIGTDKIDLSAFHLSAANLLIGTNGASNSVYLEQTPGTFNPNTDLALFVGATTTSGLTAGDFIF
jgi:hypothetical protein